MRFSCLLSCIDFTVLFIYHISLILFKVTSILEQTEAATGRKKTWCILHGSPVHHRANTKTQTTCVLFKMSHLFMTYTFKKIVAKISWQKNKLNVLRLYKIVSKCDKLFKSFEERVRVYAGVTSRQMHSARFLQLAPYQSSMTRWNWESSSLNLALKKEKLNKQIC